MGELTMSERLAKARLAACKRWPFASSAVLSMVPVPRPGLGTLAVDRHWRLYYDEAFLAGINTDVAAGVILHEVDHLLKRHHKRAATVVPDTADGWNAWNRATDAAINSGLRAEGIALPDGVIFPESIGKADGLSAEEYFRALRQEQEAQESQQDASDDQDGSEGEDGQPNAGDSQKDGQGSDDTHDEGDDTDGNGEGEATDDGQDAAADGSQPGSDAGNQGAADPGHEGPSDGPDASSGDGGGDDNGTEAGSELGTHDSEPVPVGTSGSCSDGRQRPWELGPPDEDNPGLDEADAEQVIHVTAKNVEKSAGSGSGGHKLWAEDILNPPVDPASKLLSLVRKYADLTAGIGERSFRRPSRRNGDPRMALPGNVAPLPRITVIVDTSGSMGADDLGLALGMIRKVLNSFRNRDGIRVVTGDERGQTKAICLSDPKKLDLRGGKGTNMARIVAEVMDERVKPQMVLVCTDGWTPWPAEPIDIPLVACVSNRVSELPECYQPPGWIVTLELKGNRS